MASKILGIFKQWFPDLYSKSNSYKKIGGNGIEISMQDRSALIFQFYSTKKWSLETYESYMSRKEKHER